MSNLTATRASNRRALLAFIAALSLLVSSLGIGIAWMQSRQLRDEAIEEVRIEMAVLGEVAVEPLLRSDFAAVERLVQTWGVHHGDLMQISALMPNGYVLADYRKGQAHQDALAVEQDVVYSGRLLMKLRAVGDFSQSQNKSFKIVRNASLAAVMLILVLGWVLWTVLQRTAIRPLEAQIRLSEANAAQLKQRTVELENAVKELESFSYSVSHDLRGPLRAIDGFTHALSEDYASVLDDTARQYLARARAAAQRMDLLIDDLLALARMSRQGVHPSETDMSALARATLSRLAQTEPHRVFAVVVEDGLRAKVDARMMEVLFDNLLGNAWKYTSRTAVGQIEFGQRNEQGETVYFVRDNGAGFDMQYASKLFQPFQRLHGAEFAGTGIGLATVDRIVRLHGGKVWAEAQPGKGATFYFTLAAGSAAAEIRRQ